MATLVVGTDSKEWVSTGSTAITPPNQLNPASKNVNLSGNDRKVTPASPQLPLKPANLSIVTLGLHRKRRRRRKNVDVITSTAERQKWLHKTPKITST